MNVPTIDAVDPNSPTASSKELAVVVARSGGVRDIVSPGSLQPIIQGLERDTLELEAQTSRVKITDDASFARAGALRSAVSSVLKSADKSRKTVGDPFRLLTDAVNDLFKVYTSRLNASLADLDKEITRHNAERRRKQQEAEEAARKEAERLAADLAAKAAQRGANEATQQEIKDAVIEAATPAISTSVDAFGVKTDVKRPRSGLVVNSQQLLMYLVLHPEEIDTVVEFRKSAINNFAKSHVTEVDGVFAGVRLIEIDQVRNF